MALDTRTTSAEDKKRNRDSVVSSDEDEEGWTKVTAKRKDQRATPPGTRIKPTFELENPSKFRVVANSPKEAYQLLKDFEGKRQGLKIHAKPNLAGQ